MGMLTDEQAVDAFITNAKDRRWDVDPSMSIDEQTAMALLKIAELNQAQRKMRELRSL